ncbi:WASH complex subunit 2-like [Rhincodon typus]|uniref:WASH complex subunit 2-like n=1 Tax=Rhincodon typus TaxID=259920 RepID=UPI00202E69E5|nr:WASH complex subunit 2-like [Rhincodon typus]
MPDQTLEATDSEPQQQPSVVSCPRKAQRVLFWLAATKAGGGTEVASQYHHNMVATSWFMTSTCALWDNFQSSPVQNAQLHSEVVESSPPLGEKSQTSSGLFSDDDDSQDLFSTNKDTKRHQSKQSLGQNASNQNPISFFDDDEGDLFSSAPLKDVSATKKLQQLHDPKAATTGSKSTALFDSDDKDEWQSLGQQTSSASQPVGGRKQEVPKATATSRAPKKTSLFDDYTEEDDLFGVTQKESQKKSQKVSLLFEDDDEGDLFASKPAANKPAPSQKPSPPQGSSLFSEVEGSHSVAEFDGKRQVEQGAGVKPVSVGAAHLFAGIDVLEQQSDTKVLDSDTVVSQECDDPARQSVVSLPGELHSNLNSVVSLFDGEEDDNLEDMLNQCSLIKNEKLPEAGVSTRVFQDEELLFSQQQQKDNDPDVDLFADTLKPEVKKPEKKPPVSPPPTAQAGRPDLPSCDLFDETDNLFSTSKPRSAKTPSSKGSIFEDGVDEDLFRTVPKKPSVPQTKPKFRGTGMSLGASTKTSEPPKETCDEVLKKQRPGEKERLTNTGPIKTKGPSSRIGKLQANLAINPASLLPGASPKVAVVPSGSATPSSPSDSSLRETTPSASGPVAGESITASFDQPVQVDVLPSVNKSRARVGQKRRPPTRVARRLAAQQFDKREDLDQRTEVDGVLSEASGIADISPVVTVQKPHLDKTPTSLQAGNDASPSFANSTKLPVCSSRDLFDSNDLFKPNVTQEPTPAVRTMEDLLPKEDPVQSIFAPSEDDLFQSSKWTVKKPKPVAFLQEDDDDLFGAPKLGKTKLTGAQKSSKTLDIFEDDLFSTESVTLTKKSNEGSANIDLFSDHVDIFADLKVAPKEKKSRKKVETKSIFDDDMDDIFASATPSSNSKKQSKSKSSSKQAAVPVSIPDSKTVDIFDDPLNAFGP